MNQIGRLHKMLGRFGSFIGCTRYPDCKYTSPYVKPPKQAVMRFKRKRKPLPEDTVYNEDDTSIL